MSRISDLTKDTRPTLMSLLQDAIYDIVELDAGKSNDDQSLVAYENQTFYYRSVFLFMERAIEFYDESEVEFFCKDKLLREAVLPDISEIGNK